MNAYGTAVRAKSPARLYPEAANDARYRPADAEEARAARCVKAIGFVRCVLGPIALFVLLVSSTDWSGADRAGPVEASELARATAVFRSFPEQVATRLPGLEAHAEAF